jgi:hypothetical protein
MQPEKAAPRSGPPTLRLVPVVARPDLDQLRAAWGRGAALVQTLVAAVSGGIGGGRAERALRAAGGRIGSGGRGHPVARAGVDAEDTLRVSLPLDGLGPRAARTAVEGLRGRMAPSVLDDALLVVSELVTNAVRHSGASDGGVVVLCVELTGTMVRLEVTDPGCGGVIAPRAPDLEDGGGFGLHVVRALSERWGLEQVAAGETRVWAQLPRVPTAVPPSAQGGDAAGEFSQNGHRAAGERQPSAGVRVREQGP